MRTESVEMIADCVNSEIPKPIRWRITLRKSVCEITIGLMLVGLCGCAPETPQSLGDAITLYRQNRLEEARSLFQQTVVEAPNNADAHAWLAETHRRLGDKEMAINEAEIALENESCHSFAHTVLGYVYNPMYGNWEHADSELAWEHFLDAVACDSLDGNAWRGIWPEAIRRGNRELQSRALHSLGESGFFTPAVMAYNRWMLKHLPENAMLLTEGDLDTYPAVALQEIEGLRTDVVIVNYSLLNLTWYARHLRDVYGLELPFDEAGLEILKHWRRDDGKMLTIAFQMMSRWLDKRESGEFDRPIALAITVGDRSFAANTEDHLVQMGAYSLWLPEATTQRWDTTMMRQSLASITPEEFSGSFVGSGERSPVLLVNADRMASGITNLAVDYGKILIGANRLVEANDMLIWAENFERNTVADAVFDREISALRKTILDLPQ